MNPLNIPTRRAASIESPGFEARVGGVGGGSTQCVIRGALEVGPPPKHHNIYRFQTHDDSTDIQESYLLL